MKIRYDLDLTEPEQQKLSGGTDLAGAICILWQSAGAFKDSIGTIYTDAAPENSLRFASAEAYGAAICIHTKEGDFLSLCDAGNLAECIDFGGEDRLVSEGLFISEADACKAIRYFAENGKPHPALNWCSPEDLPETGSYII